MPDPNAVSILLRRAREERGLDLDGLARKTGVARNHLVDIEAGNGRAFHSVAYCRKAVDMVAREFGLEQRVSEAWQDRDWMVPEFVNPRLASLEASPPTLLPSSDAEHLGQARKWLAPLAGVLGLVLVGWLAMGRIDQEPEPSAVAMPVQAPSAPGPAANESATASPAPAPGVAGPSGTGSAVTVVPGSAFRDQVQQAMAEWARLWRNRQPEAYAAFYDASFSGRDQHLGVRRQRMAQASSISVDISDLQIRETGPGEISVRFRQVYRSDNYQSDDRKEIVWRQTAQGPKITAERLVN